MATANASSSGSSSSSCNAADFAVTNFYFSDTELQNTPSRRNDISVATELYYRQTCALCIQELGMKLGAYPLSNIHVHIVLGQLVHCSVVPIDFLVNNQLTINTALVYMHRFYMFHSLASYNLKNIAACAIFLASKSEEHPNKLNKVITAAYEYFSHESSPLDPKSEKFLKLSQDLVDNEYAMLLTLGKCALGMKELAQTAYFLASQSSHLSTLCLQHKPVIIAGVCIHIACKWLDIELPILKDGGAWYKSLDPHISLKQLDDLACKFLHIIDTCPSKLKKSVAFNMDKAGLKQSEIVRKRFMSGGSNSLPSSIKSKEQSSSFGNTNKSTTATISKATTKNDDKNEANHSEVHSEARKNKLSDEKHVSDTIQNDKTDPTPTLSASSDKTMIANALTQRVPTIRTNLASQSETLRKSSSTPNFMNYGHSQSNSRLVGHMAQSQKRKLEPDIAEQENSDVAPHSKKHMIENNSADHTHHSHDDRDNGARAVEIDKTTADVNESSSITSSVLNTEKCKDEGVDVPLPLPADKSVPQKSLPTIPLRTTNNIDSEI
ncbi:Cyclin-T2 [Trichoplax sp. H2]|nr:Cyclin-T2 [Trichoplax sp. H2]|eukprot:RDD39964.1 Cyclin-T2 [Trichoplax sp. H2]